MAMLVAAATSASETETSEVLSLGCNVAITAAPQFRRRGWLRPPGSEVPLPGAATC